MRDSIQRLLTLRQYPGFANAELSELAVVAENVVEVDLPAGAVVTPLGRVPALHLVIEGRIDYGRQSFGPRDVFGALEAIAGRATIAPAIAVVPTKTLQLCARELANILEDNFGLLSQVRRTFARQLLKLGYRGHVRPRLPYAVRSESLGLVDRLVLLRHQITFATGKIQAIAALAQTTREVRFNPGEMLVRAGEPATRSLVLVDGAVRVNGRVLGPNDALGVLESLAETGYAFTAEALTPVRTLECPTNALFDVIEDHTDLALALVARLASELIEGEEEPALIARVN